MAKRQKQQLQETEEKKALNREKTRKKKMLWISLSVEERKKLLFNKKKAKYTKKGARRHLKTTKASPLGDASSFAQKFMR